MMGLTGYRRLLALALAFSTLIWISILAVGCKPEAIPVLMVTGGAVGGIVIAFLGADGFVKARQNAASQEHPTEVK